MIFTLTETEDISNGPFISVIPPIEGDLIPRDPNLNPLGYEFKLEITTGFHVELIGKNSESKK